MRVTLIEILVVVAWFVFLAFWMAVLGGVIWLVYWLVNAPAVQNLLGY